MKLFTIGLLLVSYASFSQIKVEAESYSKAKGVLMEVVDSGIVGVDNSYADYSISIPKSGIYDFDFFVSNRDGQKATISIKTPTGKKILSSIDVPEGGDQVLSTSLKLGPTTKKIRLEFSGNGILLNNFAYTAQGAKATYALKSDYDKLKKSFDSLLVVYEKNKIYLDGNLFAKKDSVITLINAPVKSSIKQ